MLMLTVHIPHSWMFPMVFWGKAMPSRSAWALPNFNCENCDRLLDRCLNQGWHIQQPPFSKTEMLRNSMKIQGAWLLLHWDTLVPSCIYLKILKYHLVCRSLPLVLGYWYCLGAQGGLLQGDSVGIHREQISSLPHYVKMLGTMLADPPENSESKRSAWMEFLATRGRLCCLVWLLHPTLSSKPR